MFDADLLIKMGLDWLMANVPYAVLGLTILGGIVVAGQIYVSLSPRKDDDAWLEKIKTKPFIGTILKILAGFAPFQKK